MYFLFKLKKKKHILPIINSNFLQRIFFHRYGEYTHDSHKNEELRSKFFKYDNIEERSQDESDEGEQGGRRQISIDDSDSSLPIDDYQQEDDTHTDFHAFWKGEGNEWAIREAQGTFSILSY